MLNSIWFCSVCFYFCCINIFFSYIYCLFPIMCVWKEILRKKNQNPSPNIRSQIQEVFLVPSYMLMTFVIGSIFICLVLKQHSDLRNYLVYFVCSQFFSWDLGTCMLNLFQCELKQVHIYATADWVGIY